MTQVPTKPTPRPLQINVPNSFNNEQNDTRVLVIVKDPESDFKS